MNKFPKILAISPVLRVDWEELCKQRLYIANEADNKKGEEGEVLKGLQSLLDAIADGVYDTYPMYEKELVEFLKKGA